MTIPQSTPPRLAAYSNDWGLPASFGPYNTIIAQVSHAPQAPYLGCRVTTQCEPKSAVPGYPLLLEQYGESIDFLNIQFHNNPPFNTGPEAAALLKALVAGGSVSFDDQTKVSFKLPPEKLLLGKPAIPGDATNGYISPADLESALQDSAGCVGGFMTWKLKSDANQDFEMGNAAAKGLSTSRSRGSAASL